ncbi:structural protein [Cellulophaga phage phi19:2]|uniref:Structural protein n=3 Tax=Cellulophaga phage phiST TaxID=756282 RepID=M4SK65_9CAUD|nr:virion structural protein [Cellulophaga phage phiST]AGH56722.1 hypothetical protein CGPG_00023 [Cellulophaga phage phiST]AGO47226.1 structural protein [Cellulophaga phage phiST]AGO48722.1 structural protein [Cellulophaga phage phi19:2]AGO49092.1 structural protein [Cellulophaga phage phi13:1]
MYKAVTENQLIISDIASVMSDYTSIQIDIDERKVKAAALVAQRIDIKRLVNQSVLDRLIDVGQEYSDTDQQLLELIIPPLCYYTYYRCLLMFQGTFTDSGYVYESEAESRNAAKSVANQMKSIGDDFMLEVEKFLNAEKPSSDDNISRKVSSNVRVFGGEEFRGNN